MRHRAILFFAFAMIFGLSACEQKPEISSESVTLIIHFKANDEGERELSQILAGVPDAMASEPGFVSAKIYRNTASSNVFVLEEIWKTQALHEAHFARINASGDWQHINTLLIEAPDMGYYRRVRQ